jgi:hypothetical protein
MRRLMRNEATKWAERHTRVAPWYSLDRRMVVHAMQWPLRRYVTSTP